MIRNLPYRADHETHHWDAGSGLHAHVEKKTGKVNPLLTLVQGERRFELEVSQLDLQALESAVAILRQIKDAGRNAPATTAQEPP